MYCAPDIWAGIINRLRRENDSELMKSVATVKQKFRLIAEFQNGETVTKVAEDYKPNISDNKLMEFASNCEWC